MSGLEEATCVLDQFKGDYDFSKGILQAIGYKEFFEHYQAAPSLSADQCKASLDEAVEKLA